MTAVEVFIDAAGAPRLVGQARVARARGRVSTTFLYDPAYLANARDMLTTIYLEVQTHAEAWDADHLRTTPVRGKPITVDKRRNEAQSS